jgi:hypothetical protein
VQINHWEGVFAVALALISFYGTTYLVVALNLGWRFGYWVCGATFGVLMVMLSLFWIINPVGPRGEDGHWVPVAAGKEVSQAQFEGKTLQAPGQYPGGPWKPAEEDDAQGDAFSSAVTTCLTTKPDKFEHETERKICEAAQALMPEKKEIPVLLGSPVAVLPQATDVMFAEENGDLAAATVRPVTMDPRVSKTPGGKLLAPSFKLVAILDHGSVRLPPLMSLIIFTIFAAFHLAGLRRAERRKLNPAVV